MHKLNMLKYQLEEKELLCISDGFPPPFVMPGFIWLVLPWYHTDAGGGDHCFLLGRSSLDQGELPWKIGT